MKTRICVIVESDSRKLNQTLKHALESDLIMAQKTLFIRKPSSIRVNN